MELLAPAMTHFLFDPMTNELPPGLPKAAMAPRHRLRSQNPAGHSGQREELTAADVKLPSISAGSAVSNSRCGLSWVAMTSSCKTVDFTFTEAVSTQVELFYTTPSFQSIGNKTVEETPPYQ